MDENKIRDAGDARKYYTQLPNLIDDMGLTVWEFRLYCHIKRVCGAEGDGVCWQSTRTLAENCNMSIGMVTNAKVGLKQKKLIKVIPVKDKKGEHHEITIVDIWPENMLKYSGCSPHEQACSPHEQVPLDACSPHEPKNNPSINNNENEEGINSTQKLEARKPEQVQIEIPERIKPPDIEAIRNNGGVAKYISDCFGYDWDKAKRQLKSTFEKMPISLSMSDEDFCNVAYRLFCEFPEIRRKDFFKEMDKRRYQIA